MKTAKKSKSKKTVVKKKVSRSSGVKKRNFSISKIFEFWFVVPQ
jgi:hypothetical protein